MAEWNDARARSALLASLEVAMATAVEAAWPDVPLTCGGMTGLLAKHDSYTLSDTLGDLVRTGPTCTDFNDLRAVLVA